MKAFSVFMAFCLVSCTCVGQLGQGSQWGEDAPIHDMNLQDYPDVHVSWDGPVCGNGILEGTEECDDGNRRNCDGCTANCLVEEEGVCGADAGTDASADGETGEPPPPPEPQGDLIPIETAGGESPRINPPRSLSVIWTGSYYSVMYIRSCPGGGCLGMTRFDTEGVILSPEWIYLPVEQGFNGFDYCWNGHGFGLAWAEMQSLYMVLLDWNGKLVRGPVRICDGCLAYFGLGIQSPSIGCGPDGYLLSYNVEVGFLVSSRWLQKVSANLDLLDGAYLGHTDMDLVFTFSHGGSWRLIFVSETVETYPVSTYNLVLDAITDNLEYEWRSLIARFKPYDMDYDATEEEVMVVFREQDGSYTLSSLDPGDGRMLSAVSSLEKSYPRVACLGGGSAAILGGADSCLTEGSGCCALSVLDPAGLESERVVVAAGMGGLGYDVVWTGSEIGVALALPVSEGGCRYYLRRFSL
jgi:cysteine-rich repeat protein